MKVQTAFEFMLIAIFVLAFITPIWFYLSQITLQTEDEFTISYAKNAANQIAKKSDLVYSQGSGASVKIEIYIPRNVKEINITGNEINFRLTTSYGETDIFANSIANLTGSLPTREGLYLIMIKSEGEYVNISMT